MHADRREDIDQAEAGDIVAIMGLDVLRVNLRRGAKLRHAREHVCGPAGHQRCRLIRSRATATDRLARFCSASVRKTDVQRLHRPKRLAKPSSPVWASCNLEIYVERIRREYKATSK